MKKIFSKIKYITLGAIVALSACTNNENNTNVFAGLTIGTTPIDAESTEASITNLQRPTSNTIAIGGNTYTFETITGETVFGTNTAATTLAPHISAITTESTGNFNANHARITIFTLGSGLEMTPPTSVTSITMALTGDATTYAIPAPTAPQQITYNGQYITASAPASAAARPVSANGTVELVADFATNTITSGSASQGQLNGGTFTGGTINPTNGEISGLGFTGTNISFTFTDAQLYGNGASEIAGVGNGNIGSARAIMGFIARRR